ncbi:MAG: hypothetical protein ACKOYC_02475, partial [Bacteroidota bacterium]
MKLMNKANARGMNKGLPNTNMIPASTGTISILKVLSKLSSAIGSRFEVVVFKPPILDISQSGFMQN